MKDLKSRGAVIDESTIHDAVKRSDKNSYGSDNIDTLVDMFYQHSSTAKYAFDGAVDVLRTFAQRRKLQDISKDLYNKAKDESKLSEVIDNTLKELNLANHGKGSDPSKYWDLYLKTMDRLDDKPKDGEVRGYKSGLVDLDNIIGYFHFGHLDIIGARPAMGKTSLAMNFALHASLRNNINTLVISAELEEMELTTQIASIHTGVPIQDMDNAIVEGTELGAKHWEALTEKSEEAKNLPLWIDDSSCTPREVISSIRDMVASNEIQTVFIDYIQLIKTYNESTQYTRASAIGEFSYDLKRLAKELNVHIVCVCQLNRQVESRPDKRPMLSDLKESGDLEQVAYKVILIYRDEVYNENSEEEGIAELIVAKNRRGKTARARVGFKGECTQFINLEQRNEYV
tara:strand:- start:2631 stop:3830 length:1200 start_codon:yes stop_codon:yes gene_type:complete